MDLERLAYLFFGNNLIIGPHIRKQLKYLKEIVPPHFRNRQMDDLGCGDGKVTILLRDIFSPKELRGFDINPRLVKRARSRGIQAEVKNLDEDMPTGELAVMWGVLHHLRDIKGCLERIKNNYLLVFIREPIRESPFKGLELGHPMRRDEIERLIADHLAGSQVFYHGNAVIIFHTPRG